MQLLDSVKSFAFRSPHWRTWPPYTQVQLITSFKSDEFFFPSSRRFVVVVLCVLDEWFFSSYISERVISLTIVMQLICWVHNDGHIHTSCLCQMSLAYISLWYISRCGQSNPFQVFPLYFPSRLVLIVQSVLGMSPDLRPAMLFLPVLLPTFSYTVTTLHRLTLRIDVR